MQVEGLLGSHADRPSGLRLGFHSADPGRERNGSYAHQPGDRETVAFGLMAALAPGAQKESYIGT